MLNQPKDGMIQIDKDREAVRRYFLENINQNTVFFYSLKEKLDYLIENDYIESEFLEPYGFDFVKKLFKQAYAYKYRFKTFMGAHKFYKQYALKTNDGKKYLERYEDRVCFNALYLAKGDKDLAINLMREMMEERFQPATPTYLNVGRKRRGMFSSCYIIDVHDNMNDIGRAINSTLQLSKSGGGVGILLSNLREAGAPIKDIEGAGSGVVPVMKMFEDALSYANQLGQRNGAGVTYLNVFHPDIVEFLSTKKENADEKIRVKTLSLGVVVPDKYYELVEQNKFMHLFSPRDVEREYGMPFSYVNITEEYDNMVANNNIKKYKIDARELEQEISKLQQESGYPYVINIDTVNDTNPVNGEILGSNLCVHGDTKILTKQGYLTIRGLAGSKAEVWNGKEWSEVDVVQTNSNQKLLQIKTDKGHEIKTTSYHKFYTSDGVEVRAGELKVGQKLITPERLPNLGDTSTSLRYVEENPVVISVEEVEGLHDTFCFNEPKRHMGMFNGLLTGNCSEIFQVQSPSVILPDQSYEQLGVDIVCNLGSSIMSNLIDSDNFALSVETMIRGLSNVADEVDVKEVPTIQNGNDKYHAVGLGVMDAHGAMAKHGIFYGEDESLEMVEAYFSALRYEALKASMNIAIEKNERFFEFDKSAYANGSAFDHIIERDFKITSPKVKEIMSKVPVPTKEDWIKLAEEIKENGLYNGYLLALAPTGSISYVRGVTASLQPIVQKVEERQEGKTGKTFYPAPYMEDGALPYYKSAYEIDMRKMIDIYAVAQKYVDQGMSLTLFMPSEIPAGMYEWKPNGGAYTTRDLSILRNYAWNSGIKSIYYVRTFTQDGEVNNVNVCESCSV